MVENPIFFYISASVIITFALLSLFSKNIINSLLSAIMVFFAGALFYYILGSEYNAIIQAAIYGLAVPIIIGVSIMFTNGTQINKKGFTLPYITFISAGIFLLAFIWLIRMSLVFLPDTFNLTEIPQVNTFDVISVFAKGIFINYVWAFELVSLLLVIVIAGICLLAASNARGVK